MKATFRQGIIKYQNYPSYIRYNSKTNCVGLYTDKSNILLNFAFGEFNYLFTEKDNLECAWSLPNNITDKIWLYWDIDISSGIRSFSYTEYDPFLKIKPSNPSSGQMFFDHSKVKYQWWNGQSWIDSIRIIAGIVNSDFSIDKINLGSQVDILEYCQLSEIVFDNNKMPVKRYTQDGSELINKGFILKGKLDSYNIDQLVLENGILENNVTEFKCIAWTKNNTINYADPTKIDMPAFGLAAKNGNTGEVINFYTDGFIKSDVFKFTEAENTPIYVGSNGSITTIADTTYSLQKIGYIVSYNTIYLKIEEQIINGDIVITPTPTPTISIT